MAVFNYEFYIFLDSKTKFKLGTGKIWVGSSLNEYVCSYFADNKKLFFKCFIFRSPGLHGVHPHSVLLIYIFPFVDSSSPLGLYIYIHIWHLYCLGCLRSHVWLRPKNGLYPEKCILKKDCLAILDSWSPNLILILDYITFLLDSFGCF